MNVAPQSVRIVCWLARAWRILLFIVALMVIFHRDPRATEPVPAVDWLIFSLWGVAILGLLVAWRWERMGALIAVAAMVIRELAWVALRGHWLVNFLIFWLFVLPPAILYLFAWGLEKKAGVVFYRRAA